MKILHDFEYHRPRTVEDALGLLALHQGAASPLAGGTDLAVVMKHRSILQLVPGAGTPQARFQAARFVLPIAAPKHVISLASLPDLCGVSRQPSALLVGPTTTMADFVRFPDVPAAALALRDAAAIMGSPLIRARATIGGNQVNARPAADTAVALVALSARFELRSRARRRFVDAAAFFTGPGRSVREPDELLTAIEIPLGAHEGSAYLRQGNRRQLEIALVGAAAWVRLHPESGAVSAARISLGAVGPIPLLAPNAASSLVGKQPTEESLAAAALAATRECKPIDDFRGSAAFRLLLVETLVRRALAIALARAKQEGGRP